MTLNQLALEMWERLGFHDIDPSVLSRVITGERSFTPQQLEIFSNILAIPRSEVSSLKTEYCRDLLSQSKVDENFIDSITYQTDYIDQNLEKIKDAMSYDSLSLAYRWETQTENLLRIRTKSVKNTRLLKKLYSLWGKLLIEKKFTLFEHKHYRKVLADVFHIPNLFEKVYRITGDSEFLGFAQALRGRIYFQQKQFPQALSHDLTSLNYLKNLHEIRAVIIRIAQIYALLNQSSKISAVEDRLKKYQDSNQPMSSLCHDYRTLANAYIIAKDLNNAQRCLNSGWEIYDKKLKNGEGDFNIRSKITLYHTEELFYHYFRIRNRPLDSLEQEVKSLVKMFGYNSYLVEPGTYIHSKLQ